MFLSLPSRLTIFLIAQPSRSSKRRIWYPSSRQPLPTIEPKSSVKLSQNCSGLSPSLVISLKIKKYCSRSVHGLTIGRSGRINLSIRWENLLTAYMWCWKEKFVLQLQKKSSWKLTNLNPNLNLWRISEWQREHWLILRKIYVRQKKI